VQRRALIVGVGGQDGSHLADLLLERGYDVHGIARRSSVDNLRRIAHLRDRVRIHVADLADPLSVHRVVAEVRPAEVYNEADQDHPGGSRDAVAYSLDVTASAVGRTLESLRLIDKDIRFFQPLSATMFGDCPDPAASETTPFAPSSPYAVGKCAAYYLCRYYRDYFGLPVSTGILFSHDGPRRKPDYFLQRLCRWAVDFHKGRRLPFELGDKDYVVDIGAAVDYVGAIHKINTAPSAGDYVVGTGTERTALEWLQDVAGEVGLDGDRYYLYNSTYPTGHRGFVAAINKIWVTLGWRPTTTPQELIRSILEAIP